MAYPFNSRFIVRLHFRAGMNPVSICVYVAFTEQAAYQFFTDRHYPKSYAYSVRELVPDMKPDEAVDWDYSVIDEKGGLG